MITMVNFETYAQQIIFGAGSLTEIGPAVVRHNLTRLLLITSPSLRPAGHLAILETVLQPHLVATYESAQAHVLEHQLQEIMGLAGHQQINGVIGLGGGSCLGLAKAVGHRSQLPIIAIPTTYAGSEMTAVYGITEQATDGRSRKVTVRDKGAIPRLVIYDPQLTLGLPAGITASTAINALAHAIEALYSVTANPLSTALALQAIPSLHNALPQCLAQPQQLAARVELMQGAHLAGAALSTVSMALHHGLCHVLGGTAGLPHGVANAIMLPHALRFNLPVATKVLAQVAEMMGVSRPEAPPIASATNAAEYISDFIGQLGLPQRLREVGLSQSDLPYLAQIAFQNQTIHQNPRPVVSAGQLESILRAAW